MGVVTKPSLWDSSQNLFRGFVLGTLLGKLDPAQSFLWRMKPRLQTGSYPLFGFGICFIRFPDRKGPLETLNMGMKVFGNHTFLLCLRFVDWMRYKQGLKGFFTTFYNKLYT